MPSSKQSVSFNAASFTFKALETLSRHILRRLRCFIRYEDGYTLPYAFDPILVKDIPANFLEMRLARDMTTTMDGTKMIWDADTAARREIIVEIKMQHAPLTSTCSNRRFRLGFYFDFLERYT